MESSRIAAVTLTRNRSTPVLTLGLERVGCDAVLFDAEQDRVTVVLVELRLEERHRERACERRHALAQRRAMPVKNVTASHDQVK